MGCGEGFVRGGGGFDGGFHGEGAEVDLFWVSEG